MIINIVQADKNGFFVVQHIQRCVIQSFNKRRAFCFFRFRNLTVSRCIFVFDSLLQLALVCVGINDDSIAVNCNIGYIEEIDVLRVGCADFIIGLG